MSFLLIYLFLLICFTDIIKYPKLNFMPIYSPSSQPTLFPLPVSPPPFPLLFLLLLLFLLNLNEWKRYCFLENIKRLWTQKVISRLKLLHQNLRNVLPCSVGVFFILFFLIFLSLFFLHRDLYGHLNIDFTKYFDSKYIL